MTNFGYQKAKLEALLEVVDDPGAATPAYVDAQDAAHVAAADPHAQYAKESGATFVGAVDVQADLGVEGTLSVYGDGLSVTSTSNFNNNRISNVGTPTAASDAATKSYVDGQIPRVKEAVKVATTTNITLSGLQTINNYSVAAGDRVLVRQQSNNVENGIYIASTGAWTRSPDADAVGDLFSDLVVTARIGAYDLDEDEGLKVDFICTTFGTWTPGVSGSIWSEPWSYSYVQHAAGLIIQRQNGTGGWIQVSSGTNVDFYSNRIKGVGTPTATTDAANKTYVDSNFWKKWSGTQAAYDAIPVKDPDTLYVIVG